MLYVGTKSHGYGEENHVKMETEEGVILHYTKECLGFPEAGRGKEESSPRGIGGSMALSTS